MSNSIKVYFDFISPYSYLAFTQLAELAQRTGATIEYRPVHVLTLMKEVGNRPTTVECPARGRYAMIDLARWAQQYKTPLVPNPNFRNIDTTPLLLGAISAKARGQVDSYCQAVFEGIWSKQAAFATEQETVSFLEDAGVENAAKLFTEKDQHQPQLKVYLDEAVDRGVFGVPSFVYGDDLYFGNDRLQFLEEALSA